MDVRFVRCRTDIRHGSSSTGARQVRGAATASGTLPRIAPGAHATSDAQATRPRRASDTSYALFCGLFGETSGSIGTMVPGVPVGVAAP